MNAAEKIAKEDKSPPRGTVEAVGPDGATKIYVKPPRGPGPWFRVKHQQYGHRLVQAKDEAEALRKFFEEFSPGNASDPEWCQESMRLNGGRIARLPDGEAEAKPEAKPAKAKK